MFFLLKKEKNSHVRGKIVRKAMKRSLSNFWHPYEVPVCLNKGAFVAQPLHQEAAGNRVLNGALRSRVQSFVRSLQSRRCYLWGQTLHKTPSKQEYLCAWNLRNGSGGTAGLSQPWTLCRRGPQGEVEAGGTHCGCQHPAVAQSRAGPDRTTSTIQTGGLLFRCTIELWIRMG